MDSDMIVPIVLATACLGSVGVILCLTVQVVRAAEQIRHVTDQSHHLMEVIIEVLGRTRSAEIDPMTARIRAQMEGRRQLAEVQGEAAKTVGVTARGAADRIKAANRVSRRGAVEPNTVRRVVRPLDQLAGTAPLSPAKETPDAATKQ